MKNNVLSLFSSAGIAEFGFDKTKNKIVISSELLPIRMDVHRFWHPHTETIQGDIVDSKIKDSLISKSKEKNVNFIFATPPCQGVSLIGKNKSVNDMLNDDRNYLIFHVFDIIDAINPEIILIENVPRYLKMKFYYQDKLMTLEEILMDKYSKLYNIKIDVFNSADYGIPQSRDRAIIRMWNDKYTWDDPVKEKTITLREAIGFLPSLESNENSGIKNHVSRKHTDAHISFMKHTPTGKSAFDNEFHFPRNIKTGKRLKGFSSTYKRMEWDKPSPTITMRNDAISSQSNVHPGRLNEDGTYSDARVLTLRELFILSSMDPDLDVPEFASDIQIRNMIGEAVPPKLINKILKGLKYNE